MLTGKAVPAERADPQPEESARIIDTTDALLDLLRRRGRLRDADLNRARSLLASGEDPVPLMLIRLGLVAEQDVVETLSEICGVPLLQADDYPELPASEAALSPRFLRAVRAVPVTDDGEALTLAVVDPRDSYPAQAIAVACERPVKVAIGFPSHIEQAIERCYGSGRSAMDQLVEDVAGDEAGGLDDVEQLKDLASEAPIVRLVSLMIQRAVSARASDIHIEPFEERLKVRFRVDGVLHEIEEPPVQSMAAVISRIKIMARLDIAERRLPQDGRVRLRVQGRDIDLRVSVIPSLHGESVVMRLLDQDREVLGFTHLGFRDALVKRFVQTLDQPHGIILVTGPTGSGKTTTLYTALSRLNSPSRKILTVEDPVEYQLEGINQIQVKPQIGLTFANALRAMVRQDPDVIMIGEMRDRETASIAVQSALTGHLVLSTLHTNDAAGAITRLLDMGVADYLLTSTVNGILAQRLVRALCAHCRRPYPAPAELVAELGLDRHDASEPITLYRSVGCDQCDATGYHGRMGVLEFMTMSEATRHLVLKHADTTEIHRAAVAEGMRTMLQDGLDKALAGETTLEEVLRVTQDD